MRIERPTTAASLSGSIDHPLLGNTNYSAQEIRSDPDGQVADTIRIMGGYVNADVGSAGVMEDARKCLGANELETVANVWALTQRKIQFLRDETVAQPLSSVLSGSGDVVEVLVRPRDMAGMQAGARIGDCDDYSMYAACLLGSLGIPCAFVTVAGDERNPGRFTHVYVAAYPKGGDGNRVRVALDASHGPGFGWEILGLKPWLRKQEWAVDGSRTQECEGGGWGVLVTAGLWAAAGWVAWQVMKGRTVLGV